MRHETGRISERRVQGVVARQVPRMGVRLCKRQGRFHYRRRAWHKRPTDRVNFRVTLPNLLYGFTDEQLVAAVDGSPYGVPKRGAKDAATHHDTPPVTPPVDEKKKRLIQALKDTPLGTSELLKALHIRDRNYLREGYIRPTLRAGFIEQTRPDVKHSKLQKYRLTEKGRAALTSAR